MPDTLASSRQSPQHLVGSVLWAILALAFPGLSVAQTTERDRLARDFAPMIWLAPDEPAYPMMPFPFAFDGIDNDGDGCVDLEDPDEINALVPSDDTKKAKQAKQEEIRKLLERLGRIREGLARRGAVDKGEIAPDQPRATKCGQGESAAGRPVQLANFRLCGGGPGGITCGPQPVIVYDVQSCDDRTDHKINGLPCNDRSKAAIQYWLYYPWDDEHLHDGEHVTVVLGGGPADYRVEAVVGAGHFPSTANNVLVSADPLGGYPRYPRHIPNHLPILSELGKHASAPDLNCNGRFDEGQDANDLPNGAWGTRDANSALGRMQVTEFRSEDSFERNAGTLLVELSALSAPGARTQYLRACPPFSLGSFLVRQHLDQDKGNDPSVRSYRLVDAEILRRLTGLFSCSDLERQSFLQIWNELFRTAPPSESGLALKSLQEAFHFPEPSTDPRPDVWNHKDFGDISRDFKLRLFPTLGAGLALTGENGNLRSGAYVRFGGRGRWFRENSVEVQGLLDNLRNSVADLNAPLLGQQGGIKWEIRGILNLFSTSYTGPFFGVFWRQSDRTYSKNRLVAQEEGSLVSHDFIVVQDTDSVPGVEAGFAFAVPPEFMEKVRLPGKSILLRVGVGGPLYRPTRKGIAATQGDITGERLRYQNQQWAELRISAQVNLVSLIKRRHPLQTPRATSTRNSR